MSLPVEFTVRHFRAFAGEESLPLRPITLLFGPNNAGKSSLLRLISMIGGSLDASTRGALEMPDDLSRGGTFVDLASKVDVGDYSFEFGFRWPAGPVREARYTLDGHSGKASYVKELLLRDDQGELLWSGNAAPNRPLTGADGSVVTCDGLLPRERTVVALADLAQKMSVLKGHVSWIDGVRARPPRRIERTGTAADIVSGDGRNAAKLLVERPDVRAIVASFYESLSLPRELGVVESLDVDHRLTLNPRSQPLWDVDIVDTGEGMAQVLPVLVAAALTAKDGGILAIEEPESHLHADAQGTLARYLCQLAAASDPPILLLETHSRIFLLAVQLAVAAGLPPDRVGLVWIDQDANGQSRITPVDILPSGHLGEGWPNAALTEDLSLASQFAALSIKARG